MSPEEIKCFLNFGSICTVEREDGQTDFFNERVVIYELTGDQIFILHINYLKKKTKSKWDKVYQIPLISQRLCNL